jgi:hypothetical protein
MLLVPRVAREQCDDIHRRCFILPPDMGEDSVDALESYNQRLLVTWEFDQ